MVIKYEEILNVVTTLGDDENLQVTVKRSIIGGLIAGVICTVGGLIAGPIGLVFGGTAGGFVASYFSGGFKPMSTAIREMRPADQRKLVDSVTKIVENAEAMDAIELLALIQGSSVLKAKVVGEMTTYCQDRLSLNVSSMKA